MSARPHLVHLHLPILVLGASLSWLALSGSAEQSGWPQFGGPRRDFTADVKGLAASWPVEGPRQVWKREIGDGFSPIAVQNDWLYTVYQRDDVEAVVALDADTGHTLWQHAYRAPVTEAIWRPTGPRATPLVVGKALYSTGATGHLHRLHAESGALEWHRDLPKEFSAAITDEYSGASPLAFRNTIILPVGGPGAAVVAFDQKSGRVVWQAHDFRLSDASPILIEVDGQTQVVVVVETEVVGLDPTNGALLWTHPHANRAGKHVSTPIWGSGNILVVSSRDNGTRALKLARQGGATTVEELWVSRDLRMHPSNPVRVADTIYGHVGPPDPSTLTALDVRTGQVRWQQREVPKGSIIAADGKFLMLSEEGELLLATPESSGLRMLARAQLLAKPALTPPSLAGTRLYLRDRRHALAVELK